MGKVEKINYEQAMKRIEEIAGKMENGQLGIDELADNLKEAQKLIKMCKDKLTKTDEEIKKLLSEDE